MLDMLRQRMAAYLRNHQVGVLSVVSAAQGALPVRYHSDALAVYCLIARWTDILPTLEQDPTVELVIAQHNSDAYWMQYRATARVLESPDFQPFSTMAAISASPFHYVVVELTPHRIDLIDQRRGWGARETLEL